MLVMSQIYNKQVFHEKYDSWLNVYVLFHYLVLYYLHLISQAIIRPDWVRREKFSLFSEPRALSIRQNFRKFRVGIEWNGIFSGKDFRKFRTNFSVFPKSGNFGIFVFHSKASSRTVWTHTISGVKKPGAKTDHVTTDNRDRNPKIQTENFWCMEHCGKHPIFQRNNWAIQMKIPRSVPVHLSFRFYLSRQADYRHVQSRSLGWFFMSQISPLSRQNFRTGRCHWCKPLLLPLQHLLRNFTQPVTGQFRHFKNAMHGFGGYFLPFQHCRRNRLSLTITTWERAPTKLYNSQSCFWVKSRGRIVARDCSYGERARSFRARKTAARVSKTLHCACKLKF